ncbi:MAG: pilus assembly protein PilM [Fimbriimonadaceae bacterium]|nr:pilus assembly protein PilM [Fimbriimonadaceae bacterium]
MRTAGIEIGATAVRLVVGDVRRGRLQLLEAASLPLTGSGPAAVSAALAPFLTSRGKGLGQVVVGLPLPAGIVKLVNFPATSEENLLRLARADAESRLPLPLEQVWFDHSVVSVGGAGQEAVVALVASRREAVLAALEPFDELGLTPAVVDVSATALANLCGPIARRDELVTAVIELGDEDVQLLILDAAGQLRQVRSITAQPAEIADEVRRSLQAYAGASGQAVGQALVVGPGAADGVAVLADALTLPVRLAKPWDGHELEAGFADRGASFAVATGLALRSGEVPLRINLRPPDPVKRAQAGTNLAGVAVGLLALLLVGGCGWFWNSWQNRKQAAAAATQAVADAERVLRDAGGEDPAFLALLQRTASEVRRDHDWLAFLKELALLLPNGVAIEELNCDRGRPVTLRGQSYNNAAIAAAMDVLNDLGRFEAVRLDFANAQKVGDEVVYGFQITCPWRSESTPSARRAR